MLTYTKNGARARTVHFLPDVSMNSAFTHSKIVKNGETRIPLKYHWNIAGILLEYRWSLQILVRLALSVLSDLSVYCDAL